MAISANYFSKLYQADSYSMLFNYGTSASGTSSLYSGTNSLSSLISGYNNTYGVNTAGGMDSGVQSFLKGLKSSSEGLSSVMKELQSGTSDKETVISSNSAAVSVKSKYSSTEMDDTKIKVDQVASGQVNAGKAFNADSKAYMSGSYKFEIETGGEKHLLSFSATSSDTYEDVQKKMAKAINDADIGIKASALYDDEDEKSSLRIESEETGEDSANSFKINDVLGSAVSKLGVGSVTQEAQNAIYSIDGGELIESESNEIDLGKGVTATLKKATTAGNDVTIGMGIENKVTYENVEKMVKEFNTLLGNTSENSSDRGAARLARQLGGLSDAYSGGLEDIGIKVDSEGYLSIDKDKLETAIEDGSASKFFSDNKGSSFGFANRLSKISEDVSKNPTSYVSKQALGNYLQTDDSSYNYLLNYRYNQVANQGLLFDMLL